jgi:TDG/mug DNA glycosylase family protein
MRLLIVGCNPGERSVRAGHYYAGRGNVFWDLLFEGGVIPEPIESRDDRRVIEFGVGLTDLVKRPTRGIESLAPRDFAEGRVLLSRKLGKFAPRVVAFHGKLAYEKYAQRKCVLGLQEEILYGARVFVLPSASEKNARGREQKRRYFQELAALLRRLEA